MKLTERTIGKLTVERGQKDRLFFDDVQRGLAVRVTASGGRSYLAQYTLHGTKHRVPLKSCAAVSLAKARDAAAAIMGDVAKGRNPAADRKEAAAAAKAKAARDRHTLATLIDDWERLHLAHQRPRYAAEAVRALRHAFARHLSAQQTNWIAPPLCAASMGSWASRNLARTRRMTHERAPAGAMGLLAGRSHMGERPSLGP
jgi:hypothetical protein